VQKKRDRPARDNLATSRGNCRGTREKGTGKLGETAGGTGTLGRGSREKGRGKLEHGGRR